MSASNIIQCKKLIAKLSTGYLGEPLSFELNTGEVVSIIGTDQSSKSRWLKTLCGLQPQQSGILHINGIDTLHLSSEEWTLIRRKVSYIHADTALLSAANGLENMMIPALYHRLDRQNNKQSLEEKALEILKEIDPELNLTDLPAYIPKEQHFKIAVARALLLEPNVMVLDDAFSRLSNESKRQFQVFLDNRIQQGLSLLITTDDISYALAYSDKLLFAERDRLHVFDPRQAILDSKVPVIDEYLSLNA